MTSTSREGRRTLTPATKKKTRKTARQICQAGAARAGTWRDRLSADDLKIAEETKAIVLTEHLEHLPVARDLKTELNIDVSAKMICEWFRAD